MTKAKRLLASGLAAVMAMGMLTGCGGGGDTGSAGNNNSASGGAASTSGSQDSAERRRQRGDRELEMGDDRKRYAEQL